jgi:hypothetical protein
VPIITVRTELFKNLDRQTIIRLIVGLIHALGIKSEVLKCLRDY